MILLSLCLSVVGVQARKWLPAPGAPRAGFRLRGCAGRGADRAALGLLAAAVVFMRLGFAAQDREQRRAKKIHQQPGNTVQRSRRAG